MQLVIDNEFLIAGLNKIEGSSFYVGHIVLNRPKVINALNTAMVSDLFSTLVNWQSDESIVAVVISGNGDRGFCAGGDIKAMYHSAINPKDGVCVDAEQFFKKEYQLDFLVHNYSKPIIAWGHGLVMGGGWGLFAGASHRIAFSSSVFAMPEITIALFPDVAAYHYLSDMPYNLGLYCCLTGAQLSASDALYYGLADAIFADDLDINDFIGRLTQQPLLKSGNLDDEHFSEIIASLALAESAWPDYQLKHYEQDIAISLKADDSIAVYQAITEHSSQEGYLGINAQRMLAGSPLCFANIYHGYHYCKGKSLAEVFEHNLHHAIHVIRHPEFAEGVRALVIDKDKKPQWLYQTLSGVPELLPFQMTEKIPEISITFK